MSTASCLPDRRSRGVSGETIGIRLLWVSAINSSRGSHRHRHGRVQSAEGPGRRRQPKAGSCRYGHRVDVAPGVIAYARSKVPEAAGGDTRSGLFDRRRRITRFHDRRTTTETAGLTRNKGMEKTSEDPEDMRARGGSDERSRVLIVHRQAVTGGFCTGSKVGDPDRGDMPGRRTCPRIGRSKPTSP